jgi:hypothetical protein
MAFLEIPRHLVSKIPRNIYIENDKVIKAQFKLNLYPTFLLSLNEKLSTDEREIFLSNDTIQLLLSEHHLYFSFI